ncbi:MAG TPA: ThuA domain-containing protein [Polyangia bacterium]|nr:ThuA domain-containing protein [Polyangia bacterium]
MRVRFGFWILAAGLAGACSSPGQAPLPDNNTGTGGAAVAGTGGSTGGSPLADAASGSGGQGQIGTGGGGPDGTIKTDGPTPTAPDAGSSEAGAATGSTRVLIYTLSTGFVHDSTPVAADFISRSARVAGLQPETSADPKTFTPAGLAVFGAIILIANAGEPLGPGTTGPDALIAYVKGGGALVGIENCTHAYDNYDPYVSLLGGDFAGHPTGFLTTTCAKEGTHPSVAMLPATFNVTDEIYAFTKFRMDNQVVLRCDTDRRPVSWYREEGAGRVFYTALGHSSASWQMPPLVDQHVIPGLLWAMRR